VPRYIIERNVDLKSLTKTQFQGIGRKSNQVIASMPGVVWIKSYVSEAEGKIYCEYDAPNPQAVLEHARRTGIPADRISEVSLEINPDMFR